MIKLRLFQHKRCKPFLCGLNYKEIYVYFRQDTNLPFPQIIIYFLFQLNFLTRRAFLACVCVSPQEANWLKHQSQISASFNNFSTGHRFDRVYGIMFRGEVSLAWITLFLFLMFNPTTSQEVNLIRFLYRQKFMSLSLCKKLQASCSSLSKIDGQTVQRAI